MKDIINKIKKLLAMSEENGASEKRVDDGIGKKLWNF